MVVDLQRKLPCAYIREDVAQHWYTAHNHTVHTGTRAS